MSSEATAPVERYGSLSVRGTQLCDRRGEPVQLRGVSTHGLQWYGWGRCINESSLDALAYEWRIDILRVALYVQEGGYETDPPGFRRQVDRIVRAAAERGLYVLIDWHVLTPGDPMVNKEMAEEFFDWAAERYSGMPHVLYEIANEPNGVDWRRVKTYAESIVPVIRRRDENAVIVVGTRGWSSLGVSEGSSADEIIADPVEGGNLMYAFHFYAATHGEKHRRELERACRHLPIFVTEWGLQEYTGDGPNDFESAQAYVDLMRERRISWIYWNFSDNGRSGAAFWPGRCGEGNWSSDEALKPAGVWVRDELRRWGADRERV